MPEPPEVETTRRGIEPHVTGQKIREIIIRRHDLRQPVPEDITSLEGRKIKTVTRRSKYLLLASMIPVGSDSSFRWKETTWCPTIS